MSFCTRDKGSEPVAFSVFKGEIYFNADDGWVGSELWKTDGTAAGTVEAQRPIHQ
jgi:hypothetical protein